jgi:DtxR family manganese transport transcriptional regulator
LSRSGHRHARTRKDHKTETAEDYCEAVADIRQEKSICRVGDLAAYFAVSHVTVSKIISRLKNEGFLQGKPYAPIELTEKGSSLARESKRRHKVVLDFLLALGISPSTAEIDAEGMEHHVSEETLQAFAEFSRSE